jgi:lipoprotein-anchoring transpeptidase ErfK/SrfK
VVVGKSASPTTTGLFTVDYTDVNPRYTNKGKDVPGGSPDNPLGLRAVWFFTGTPEAGAGYGLHGTTASNEADGMFNAKDRHLSSGCIRNPKPKLFRMHDEVSKNARDVRVIVLPTKPAEINC